MAFFRSVIEKMGVLNAAFFNLLCSGIFLMILQIIIYKKKFFKKIASFPIKYYFKVGIFLTIYMVFFYIALGEAKSREAVIVIGIINYLWVGLAFVFSILILKNKARYSLLTTGILIALTGTIIAALQDSQWSFLDIKHTISKDLLPYFLAFIAAIAWGIYSNVTKRYQINEDLIALPFFFILTSLLILIVMHLQGKSPQFNLPTNQILEFAYIVIFPTSLAYFFWDQAMKRGNKNLILVLSYSIPLISTLVSGFYLQVKITSGFYLATVLVILGAILCHRSIIKE